MTLHGQILALYESYLVNSKKFEEKGTKGRCNSGTKRSK